MTAARRTRRRRFTAERRTTVIERFTAEEEDAVTDVTDVTDVLNLAPGWDEPASERHLYLAQRTAQRDQALGLLAMWDASADPGEPVPGWLIRQAVIILRAGPGATPLELAFGRSA